MNFDYLFKNNPSDLQSLVAERTQNNRAEIADLKKAYDARQAEAAEVSLAERIAELGITEGTSKGGWPQISVGTGKTMLARSTVSAINAILSIAADKYEILDWHFHRAWFDPTTDAEGVVSAYVDGEWKFFDWKNGSLQPSKAMSKERWINQVRKHEEIDRLLQAKEYGNSFVVVLNRAEEQAHYQERIKDRLESSLADVWEMISADASVASLKRNLLRSNGNGSGTSVEMSDERKAFVEKLSKLRVPHNITIKTPQSPSGVVIRYDPTDATAKASFLNRVKNSAPNVEFVSYEKATE